MGGNGNNPIVKEVIKVLKQILPDLAGIYLFGSRATGQADNDSDYDVAFVSRIGLNEVALFELKTELEAKLNTDIDIIDLYKANTIIQIEVLKNGGLVYESNSQEIQEFEYLTLSSFQKLNEERRLIVQDIKKRGSIYG